MSILQDYAEKEGQEVIDYSIDYADDLAEIDPSDSITTSAWISVSGSLTIDDGTLFSSSTTTVWVSGGGTNGKTHRLKNTVGTAGGRTFVRTLVVKMVNKLAYREEEETTIPVV